MTLCGAAAPRHLRVVAVDLDHLEVADSDGRRFTFPISELQATRRPPGPPSGQPQARVISFLDRIREARDAAEDYAIVNDLI